METNVNFVLVFYKTNVNFFYYSSHMTRVGISSYKSILYILL